MLIKKMKTKIIPIIKLMSAPQLRKLILMMIGISLFLTGNAQTWPLQQCIDTAQVHNKNLQMSRNNIKIDTERQKEAKANLIPKISLNGDYKYFIDLPYQLMPQSSFGGPEGKFKEIQMGVPHNMGANIQLVMPLYNPQIYGAIETTRNAAELSGLQYKKTEEQVFFDITNLYYNAQILIHQQAFMDSNLVNIEKLLETMQLLYSQQMIKKSDVSKVELQKEQLLTQRELVANNFDQVMNALKFMMGIPFQQHIQIESEITNKYIVEYSNAIPVDIQIITTQNKLLSGELSNLRESRLPSVSVFGSYGQVGFGYDKEPNDFLNFYPISMVGL